MIEKADIFLQEHLLQHFLPKMLLDDIAGEMTAIADYKKMLLLLKNEQVAALIERIVMDEELHLARLSQAYKDICTSS